MQLVKFVRSLQQVEPWKSGIRREFHPGPECETDEQIRGSSQGPLSLKYCVEADLKC